MKGEKVSRQPFINVSWRIIACSEKKTKKKKKKESSSSPVGTYNKQKKTQFYSFR